MYFRQPGRVVGVAGGGDPGAGTDGVPAVPERVRARPRRPSHPPPPKAAASQRPPGLRHGRALLRWAHRQRPD